MNLFLQSGGSSEQNISLESELVRTIGKNSRITYIPSASEGSEYCFDLFCKEKRKLGIKKCLFFPIDKPFTKKQAKDALSSEAIFLSGGNTFYFLKKLRDSKILDKLILFAKNEGVLVGQSAGSILMTPLIKMANLVPGESDENIVNLKNLKALNLTNFEVYPHFSKSKVSCDYLIKYSKINSGRPIFAFPDGSGLHVSDNVLSLHGNITCFSNGKMSELTSI